MTNQYFESFYLNFLRCKFASSPEYFSGHALIFIRNISFIWIWGHIWVSCITIMPIINDIILKYFSTWNETQVLLLHCVIIRAILFQTVIFRSNFCLIINQFVGFFKFWNVYIHMFSMILNLIFYCGINFLLFEFTRLLFSYRVVVWKASYMASLFNHTVNIYKILLPNRSWAILFLFLALF